MSIQSKSDDLTPAQRAEGQRSAIFANLLSGTQFIMQGVVMMLYAHDVLGFTPRRISYILAAVPMVALLRLAFLDQVRAIGKVRLMTITSIVKIVSILLLMVIPASMLNFSLFLAILLLFSLSSQLGPGIVWQPLIRDITTTEDRGRFFARMRFYFTCVSTLVTAVIPFLIGGNITELQFKMLLLIPAVGQINNLYWVRRIPEIPSKPNERRGLWSFADLRQTIKSSRLLRGPLLIACIFVMMGIPIYPIYLKQMLNIPSSVISLRLFAATAGGAFSLLLWGHISDQLGFKPMLKGLLYLSIIILPTHLLIAPFDSIAGYDTREWTTLAILVSHAFVAGIIAAGVGIAMITIQHALVRREESLEAMNLFQAADVMVAALFTLLAGVFLENLALPLGLTSAFGGWIHLDAIRVYLMLAGLVGSLMIIRTLRTFPNSRPYFDVTDFFSALSGSPLRVAYAQRYVYHEDESTRIQTANWLGRQANPMVLDALIDLLDDPSYDVRVAAIRSLAFTESPLAGEKLLTALSDPARQSVADHVAWALGELAYKPARDELLAHLDPKYAVRSRAMSARALGKLGDISVAPKLVELLTEENLQTSQHLVSSACRALLRLGYTDQMAKIFHMLDNMSTREDRYELMDVLCLYLGISNKWVLTAFSTTSPRQALIDHLEMMPASWHRAHSALVEDVHAMRFEAVRAAFDEVIAKCEPDPVLEGLRAELAATRQWGPVAVLASGWLLLSGEK